MEREPRLLSQGRPALLPAQVCHSDGAEPGVSALGFAGQRGGPVPGPKSPGATAQGCPSRDWKLSEGHSPLLGNLMDGPPQPSDPY